MDGEVDPEGEEDEEGECRHRTIISSGGKQVCAHCATCLETSEIPSFGSKDTKKKEAKNILKDLEKYSFPEAVKTRANELFMENLEGRTYRSSTRKAVIFACVHTAYKELGKPQDPLVIAKNIGIGRKDMSKGIRLLSPVYTGKEETKQIFIEPMDLVPEILDKINMGEEHVPSIKAIYEFSRRSQVLTRSNPQSVAAGLVYYWLMENEYEISKAEFAGVVGLSQMTIGKISQNIKTMRESSKSKS